MKLQIISILVLLFVGVGEVRGQQTDPTLTAAVLAQSEMLKKLYSKRDSTEKKILVAEGTVTVAMSLVHSVEKQMLNYLSNASSAVQNLYQVKRIAELAGMEIPENIVFLKNSIPGHLKGTAISLFVSKEITKVYTDMITLVPFVAQLVSSGSYDVTDNKTGKTEKHKVNLLNSAERYYVANEVLTKLQHINTSIYLLGWQIRTYSWTQLWFGIDPKGWALAVSGEMYAKQIINQWKRL